MKYRFKLKLLSESAVLELSDREGALYGVEIGPKRSAEYFTNLFLEGAEKMKDVEVSVEGLHRRGLGEALCHVALFEDRGLFKCSTPDTGESRNLEIYPKAFAVWLARCLESKPMTKVEYESFR